MRFFKNFNCAVLLIFFVSANVQAQVTNASHSVYKIDPWTDGLIIGLTSFGVATAYRNSDLLIHPRCPCDVNEINSFDRSVVGNKNDQMDRLSDLAVAGAVAAPVLLDWRDLGFSQEFKEDAVVFAETLSVNASLVTFAKYNVQRPLPRTYDGDPSLVKSSRGYRSFYSGHTSTVFAALSMASYTYNERYGKSNWPWLVTGVFGAAVGYARIAAGKHFYTDVLVGAGIGTAVGVVVPWLHSRQRLSHLTLQPIESGLAIAWNHGF